MILNHQLHKYNVRMNALLGISLLVHAMAVTEGSCDDPFITSISPYHCKMSLTFTIRFANLTEYMYALSYCSETIDWKRSE